MSTLRYNQSLFNTLELCSKLYYKILIKRKRGIEGERKNRSVFVMNECVNPKTKENLIGKYDHSHPIKKKGEEKEKSQVGW